jgi:RHS repeat-associated protein
MQQSGNFIFNPPLGISTSNNQISAALYDSAGNMTQDALGTQNRYDPLQQLISAGSSVVNTYDANGDLVAKTTGGSTEEYAYFGNQLMAVYQPTTNAWTDFIYANGQRVQMLTGTVNGFSSIGPNGTQSSVLTDIQGSTVGIVQPGSAPPSLSESHDYAPFGQMLNRAGGDTRFQFLGMEYNPTTNSYNSLTRAYSGAASRWMSPDSYEGSYNPIDPQSLNRYSYVGGRSTAYRDPSGMAGDQGGGFCILCIIGDIFDPFGGLAGAGPVYTPPKSQVDVMNHIGGFKIPTGLPRQVNIIGMLGLPSAGGCEFGACGGDSQSFTQGEASAAISVESGMLKYLASRYVFGPYLLDPFDSNHRLFGTHYCGPGGGGDETSTLDHDCHLHDDCYTGFGVSASVNLPGNHSTPLRPDQIAGITGCNQKLADAARSLGSAYGAKSITLWLTHGYGFLYPGTAAH